MEIDWKKKYEEALGIASRIKDDNTVATPQEVAEQIFPELAESEDERIRKFLVRLCKRCSENSTDFMGNIKKADVLDWLEKQKDASKAIEAVERIDKYIDKHLANAHDMKDSNPDKKYYRGLDDALAKMSGILQDVYLGEKQKEQKPTLLRPHKGDDNNPYDMGVSEAQEYAINRGFGIPFNDGEVYVDERYMTQTIGNIIRWADEHPKEQKPAEWSEEDDNALNYLHELIGFGFTEKFCDAQTASDMREWLNIRLKSLKNRGNFSKSNTNSPSWKPSEEQMDALNALNCNGALSYVGQQNQLISLYNDLERLM